MEYYYSYELFKGHIILLDDEMRYVIDTGSPVSFSDTQTITIGGKTIEVVQNYLGYTPASLSNNIGTQVNGLIGVDILNDYDMLIDPKNNKILITDNTLRIDGEAIGCEYLMGIPIISATIYNNTYKLIFDTGAKISYLNRELITDMQVLGEVEDFYPGYGSFVTETYLAPLAIGTQNVDLVVGVLPQALLVMFNIFNTAGIIGSELLNSYMVLYAPRRNMIVIHKIDM